MAFSEYSFTVSLQHSFLRAQFLCSMASDDHSFAESTVTSEHTELPQAQSAVYTMLNSLHKHNHYSTADVYMLSTWPPRVGPTTWADRNSTPVSATATHPVQCASLPKPTQHHDRPIPHPLPVHPPCKPPNIPALADTHRTHTQREKTHTTEPQQKHIRVGR